MIVAVGGSLAPQSTSLAALRIALDAAREVGAETYLFDIREMNLPMYVPKSTDIPVAVTTFCAAVQAANGMLWSSPLYHGTISGSFKNALDWLQILSDRDPPFLTDKVVGLISTAGGMQGLQAVNTMEFVVRALRGWAVPLVIPIAKAWQVFDEEGNTADSEVKRQLRALGHEVARAAGQFAHHKLTTDEAQQVQSEVEDYRR
jgi:FMN reductase